MGSFSRRNFLATASAALGAFSISKRFGFAKTFGKVAETSSNDLLLWYDKPAAQWVDALPIGNGRLGAMIFGGGVDGAVAKELLQLNEDTLWSGQPRDGNNPDAKNHLADVRRAVLEQQDYHLADQICRKMQGRFAEAYQPLGNLRLELDLDTACAGMQYTVGDVRFEREVFVSAPDQVVVLRVTASKPGQLN